MPPEFIPKLIRDHVEEQERAEWEAALEAARTREPYVIPEREPTSWKNKLAVAFGVTMLGMIYVGFALGTIINLWP